IYTNAEKIVMLSSSMAEKFIEDYPYTKNKITVIPSWADVNKIKPLTKGNNWFIRKYGLQDKFVVLYSGNQGRCHDFQTILDASLLLKKNNKIVFLFIGNGYQNQLIREFKISHDLHNIKLLDYQPFENLPFSLPSADLALVSIAQNAGTLIAPSKFYGHLAAGTPIALISPKNSYLENLVNSNNLGSSFLNGESNKLKEWILLMEQKDELKLTYSKNSREFIMQNYSEEIISKKYYDLINSVINID
ncbi:glycosyltransferase family 4 protein, partial [Prochlorococcus sp. AH-716-B03]|nr:glycosyltransferase family 4 protein [Prochlorococcus sp. AH-716-B03]